MSPADGAGHPSAGRLPAGRLRQDEPANDAEGPFLTVPRVVADALIGAMAVIDAEDGVMEPFASHPDWLAMLRRATRAASRALLTTPPAGASPDAEIAHFLEALPATLPVSDMAARVLQTFGRDRAWPAERIARYFGSRREQFRRLNRGRIAQDPELAGFIRERAQTVPLDHLLAALQQHFPGRYVPSRSQLHRFITRDRLGRSTVRIPEPPPAKRRHRPGRHA